MKVTPGHLLFSCIIVVSLVEGLGSQSPRSLLFKRSTDEDSTDSSREQHNSLLDPDTDDDDDLRTTAGKSTNSTEPTPGRKPKSRHIDLPENYDKLQIPSLGSVADTPQNRLIKLELEIEANSSGQGSLLPVFVDVHVRSIREIDEINEEITIELDFIVKWVDWIIFLEDKDRDFSDLAVTMNRMEHDFRSLDPVFLKSIWKPDLFIENAVSITRPELITKPIRLLFHPIGAIILSTRVTVKMDCDMEFYYYPADTQSCVFKIRSCKTLSNMYDNILYCERDSYTNKDLDVMWGDSEAYLLTRKDDNFDIKLDVLDSLNLNGSQGLYESSYIETFRVLQFKISARRKLSYHLIQTYLPSAFFIFITWLSFLIPATMVEARIGILMTTLLTLTAMFAAVRQNTPTVSYVKAIDTWMVACIFFVFLTLLEFTLLTWRRHLKRPFPFAQADEPCPTKVKLQDSHHDSKAENTEVEVERLNQIGRQLSRSDFFIRGLREENIERYGFILFSVLFLIFDVIYWSWLLICSDYFNWEVDPKYNA